MKHRFIPRKGHATIGGAPRGGERPFLLGFQGKDHKMTGLTVVYIALGCGLLAVLYGLLTIMQVLKAPS